MNITIRKERPEDYKITESVVQNAFANMEHSDKKEHELVSRIRETDGFIPDLSLVAVNENNKEIVGHILLSAIKIVEGNQIAESLALAPVSVLPDYQNKSIGRLLILEALHKGQRTRAPFCHCHGTPGILSEVRLPKSVSVVDKSTIRSAG